MSIDEDRTVCKTIEKIALDFGNDYKLSFANGGDQNNNTIPERSICDQMGINLVDGLGDKIQSSAKSIPDLPNNDSKKFICIEPVIVSRPKLLEPGSTFDGTLNINLTINQT